MCFTLKSDESKGTDIHTGRLAVIRKMGRFGTVTLNWQLENKAKADLTPVSGSIKFTEGQGEGFIVLQSKPDLVCYSFYNSV